MVAYNKPTEEFKVRRLHWGVTKFYYLYYYDEPAIIERQEEDKSGLKFFLPSACKKDIHQVQY